MKRKNLLLLCVIALVAICLASCSVLENLPGSDKLPGCIELYGSHNVKHVEAKDATCTEAGNIEYWYCEACGTVWSDSANTQQITKESTVIAKTEHEYTYACDAICVHCGELTNEEAKHTIAHVEAKDATCAEPGNIEYWYCTDCGYAWADEKLTKVTNLKSVIIPELECNIVHFEAIAPGCHYNGQIEHWVCYDCERVWQDEALTQLTNIKNVVLPATGEGKLVHMDAVAPGCHDDGCIEHWICYTCEQVWADEALTQLTNIKNVTLPATGEGKLVHIEAVKPGCHYTGNVEYWICYDCEKVWTDEALTQLSNVKNVVIPELGGDVIHVEAKAPTCYENGNIEHWYCEACGQVWADEARTQLTNHKNVILGAEHTLLVHMDAVEPGCHFTGNVEHWICYACESVWTDEALTQVSNVKNVIIPELGGDVIHVEAVEAVDCQTMGNIEYWYCEDCMQVWSDEARTQLTNMMSVKLGYGEHQYFYACDPVCMVCYEVTNPDAAHNIVFVEALEATCQSMGHIAHYKCTDCNTCWDNELGQGMPINRMIYTFTDCKALYACESKCQWCFADVETEGHTLTHVEAVDSTCIFNGNVEYWTCSDCGGYWLDEALTKSTTANAVKLPFGDHEYFYECDAWCMVCNEYTNYEAAHNISKVDAKAPTCITLGNIEYYTCEYCNGCWDNEDAFGMPLNQMMVKIGYVECETATPCDTTCKWCFNVINEDAAHNIVFVPASPVTCLEAGCTTDHYYCTNCHSAWLDKELTLYVSKGSLMIPTKGEHTYTYKCDKVCNVCLEVTAPNADHTIVHVDAVEAACHYDGNIEYWYCSDCMSVWADEALEQLTNIKNVVLPATGEGNVVHFDAVAPACHYEGNIEYWVCYTCEQVWQDEALTQLTNIKNVVLPAVGGDVVHVEAKAATCYENGNIEYWYCEECEQVWQNAALTQLTNSKNVILGAAHTNLVHFDAVAPKCHYDGNIEYWVCYDCEGVWQNEALTQLTNIKNVVLPATGEGNVVHFDAVAPGCHYEGNIEYWVCYTCEQVWQDEALTQLTNIKNVILPATGEGNVVHFDAVAPGCHDNGNIEYWVCYTCEQVWQNEALTQLTNIKNVILPATGEGNLVHFDAVAPACHYDGNIEYWVCYTCEKVWQNEALTQLTNIKNVVLPALGGDVVSVAAKDPTCTEDGNIAYWYCEECEQVWQDAALTQLTNNKNVVLGATGHTGLDDLVCDECGSYIKPADGSTITIAQAIIIASKQSHNTYTTEKYYITGIVTGLYNTQYGNFYIKDEAGNELCIYGLYEWGTNGKRYDKMDYKPVNGDEVTVYTVLGMYNSTKQGKNAWLDDVVAHEHDYTSVVTEPTCTKGGYTTHTCSICDGYYKDAETEAIGHTTTNGVCGNCGLTIGGDVVNNETIRADLDTLSANNSYGTYTTTSGWKVVNGQVLQYGTGNSGSSYSVIPSDTKAFVINGKTSAKGTITSATLSDGISKLSFNYANCYSENNGVDITITIKQNGASVASKRLDNNSVSKLTAYEFVWDLAAEGVAVSGDFTIEITNNSPSNNTGNKDRVAIWYIDWTTNK